MSLNKNFIVHRTKKCNATKFVQKRDKNLKTGHQKLIKFPLNLFSEGIKKINKTLTECN